MPLTPLRRLAAVCLASVLILITARADAPLPAILGDIFIYHAPDTLLEARAAGDIIIMATGDVMVGRTINSRMVRLEDFTFPFIPTAPFLAQADVTWVNLETPLTEACEKRVFGMRFCADARAVAGLTLAGVDLANIANNHAGDEREAGVIETVQHLTAAGFDVTGQGEAIIRTIDGRRIGFLAWNDIAPTQWVAQADVATVTAQVAALRDEVDVLLVAFHWGTEYRTEQNQRQRTLAFAAVEAGADAIIGHHPHWVQGVEIYRDTPILYSLGNFISMRPV